MRLFLQAFYLAMGVFNSTGLLFATTDTMAAAHGLLMGIAYIGWIGVYPYRAR